MGEVGQDCVIDDCQPRWGPHRPWTCLAIVCFWKERSVSSTVRPSQWGSLPLPDPWFAMFRTQPIPSYVPGFDTTPRRLRMYVRAPPWRFREGTGRYAWGRGGGREKAPFVEAVGSDAAVCHCTITTVRIIRQHSWPSQTNLSATFGPAPRKQRTPPEKPDLTVRSGA